MPLRIPQGYAVCFNEFYDIVPFSHSDKDFLLVSGYFKEDILQISKMDVEDGRWIIPEEHLIIDLGWYPDGDPDGQYTLKLATIRKDLDWETIKVHKTRDRFEVRDTIEEWLQEYILIENFNI